MNFIFFFIENNCNLLFGNVYDLIINFVENVPKYNLTDITVFSFIVELVNTVDLETLQLMKKAGCWLIAFGFESGSQKSLDMMQKGTTVEQNIEAMQFAKSAGLKVLDSI